MKSYTETILTNDTQADIHHNTTRHKYTEWFCQGSHPLMNLFKS